MVLGLEASMAKYIWKKMLHNTKTIIFFGQVPKGSTKVLFKLDFFFNDALYCCVR
jgi:hypothetical protein